MGLEVRLDRPGALLTRSCIEGALDLHNPEMFLSRENCCGLLFLRQVGRSLYCSAPLLTLPAQVRHWPHQDD